MARISYKFKHNKTAFSIVKKAVLLCLRLTVSYNKSTFTDQKETY